MVVLSLLTSLVGPYPFPMKFSTPNKIVRLLALLALLLARMVLLLALQNVPFVAYVHHALQLWLSSLSCRRLLVPTPFR